MALAAASSRSGSVRCARARTNAAGAPRCVVARAASVFPSGASSGGLEAVTAAEAGDLIKQGWKVLDVRPPSEVAKVGLEGAVEAPLFLPETSNDPGALIKRFATWSNGGWWVGATHMIPNPEFTQQVEAGLPDKTSSVLVVCQDGLRSLAATKNLNRLGYNNLAWLDGGLNTAKANQLPTNPPGKDPRYGGIAGLSEAIGWTKVQQENGDKAFAGGVNNFLLGVAVLLGLDLLSILVGYINVLINGPYPPQP